MVSYRLKLYDLPNHIKDFTNQGLLTETHLIEICKLQINLYFSPWLTTEQALTVGDHDKRSPVRSESVTLQ
jgi:hypothetical protein